MAATIYEHRIEFLPDLCEGHEAARAAREFLEGHGLNEEELFACELALVEACNNAVHHTAADCRDRMVTVDVFCAETHIDFFVRDHTPGFELPTHIPQPAPGIIRGRGLFLIRSMMDEMSYSSGDGENILRLRKYRPGHAPQHRMSATHPPRVGPRDR